MPPVTVWILCLLPLGLAGCATTGGRLGAPRVRAEVGVASFYSGRLDGAATASGERFDAGGLTAAHRTLPFGTRVRVTNLRNDRSVVLTVNDRGPWRRGRILDVSRRAARELGFLREGTAEVRIELLRR